MRISKPTWTGDYDQHQLRPWEQVAVHEFMVDGSRHGITKMTVKANEVLCVVRGELVVIDRELLTEERPNCSLEQVMLDVAQEIEFLWDVLVLDKGLDKFMCDMREQSLGMLAEMLLSPTSGQRPDLMN